MPKRVLLLQRGWGDRDIPYCLGPCCPKHGGPKAGEPILFVDGYGNDGRPMWCAVMPDFINLQESPAAFHGDSMAALSALAALTLGNRKDGSSQQTSTGGEA